MISGIIEGVSFAPILAAVAGIVAALVLVGAAAYGLYQAWQTNFGNIQGTVAVFQSQVSEAFNGLMEVIQPAIDEVIQYVTDGFNQISEWWNQNGAMISQAAEKFCCIFNSCSKCHE